MFVIAAVLYFKDDAAEWVKQSATPVHDNKQRPNNAEDVLVCIVRV